MFFLKTFKFADGSQYEGDWAFDKMNGNGNYTWPDGTHVQGQYVNEKQHGYGVLTSLFDPHSGCMRFLTDFMQRWVHL